VHQYWIVLTNKNQEHLDHFWNMHMYINPIRSASLNEPCKSTRTGRPAPLLDLYMYKILSVLPYSWTVYMYKNL
jgi:hypothetical protein